MVNESKLYILRGAYFGIGAGIFIFLFILAYDAYSTHQNKGLMADYEANLKEQSKHISLEVLDGKYRFC